MVGAGGGPMKKNALVLLLEDNPGTAYTLESIIRQLGCSVIAVATIEEAKDQWSRRLPQIVMLDITPGLPEILNLIDWWRSVRNLSQTQVIVYSAYQEAAAPVLNRKVEFWRKAGTDLKAKLLQVIAGIPPYRQADCEDTFTIQVRPDQQVVATLASKQNDLRHGSNLISASELDMSSQWMEAAHSSHKWLSLAINHGEVLYRRIFDPAISTLYGEASEKCGSPDRLHLRVSIPEEHLATGFETLCHPDRLIRDRFLCLAHPLSCRIEGPSNPNRLSRERFNTATGQLKVLVVAANVHGGGLPPITQVDSEIVKLQQAIPAAFEERGITATVHSIPSKNATGRALEETAAEGWDVIHFAGHGIHCDGMPDESGLYLWSEDDDSRSPELFDYARIRKLIRNSGASLVFLNSCYGGNSTGARFQSKSLLLGMAPIILNAGAASVVAHRGEISDDSAATFALDFYRGLAKTGEPDSAMRIARNDGYSETSKTWLSAVLFDQW